MNGVVVIVVVHFAGGILHTVDGGGNSVALEDTGIPHDQGSGGDDDDHGDDGIKAAFALGGSLLLLGLTLLFGDGGIGLAGFLFSGCAHLYDSFLSF